MKKLSGIIAGCLAIISFELRAQALENSSEENAVKKVITGETEAYVKRDSLLMFSYYISDDITQCLWNNLNGTYGSFKGLAQIRKNYSDFFKKNPEPAAEPKIERNNWYFKALSPDWMWVNFIQKTTMTDGKLFTNYETRLMKKENTGWKIAVVYSLGDHGKN
ncbi:hypothetical protein GS399_01260 [Pedobacter sp. HMF7647]|uniref:Nuclear transport factor 2 family protein n=1 Tax=Hufsiella arboris TaxID=2695275 RepID=A0A7K1Y4S6_9SPHI|nr:hypothetical protein [Hufsiella arboris]MXV49585.1 hypothetical protein [Hufsiella arboris]